MSQSTIPSLYRHSFRPPFIPPEVIQLSKPEKEFQCGALEPSIFENEIDQNRKQFKIKKVAFQKRYEGADGWKSTNSLDVNDLPKAILALQKAFEYIALSPEPSNGKDWEDGGGV